MSQNINSMVYKAVAELSAAADLLSFAATQLKAAAQSFSLIAENMAALEQNLETDGERLTGQGKRSLHDRQQHDFMAQRIRDEDLAQLTTQAALAKLDLEWNEMTNEERASWEDAPPGKRHCASQ